MRNVNFWISDVRQSGDELFLAGWNRNREGFEISIKKYVLNGPFDFDREKWHEGSFLVWDGNDLWHLELSLTEADSTTNSTNDVIPDTEFHYPSYGLSTIIYSQITGAIVANL